MTDILTDEQVAEIEQRWPTDANYNSGFRIARDDINALLRDRVALKAERDREFVALANAVDKAERSRNRAIVDLETLRAALHARDERAARIAETAFEKYQTGYNAGKWIADKIRSKGDSS